MTVGGRLRERWPLLVALAVSELVVSAVTVSALGVSALGVSAVTVSAFGVSAVTVGALWVSAATVCALGVSALLLAGARIRDGVAAVLVLKTSWQVARRAASRASCCASRCTVA